MSQSTIATNVYKDNFTTPIQLPNHFSIEINFNMASTTPFITLMIGATSSNYYYHGFGNSDKQLTMAISRNNNRAGLIDDISYKNQVTDHFTVGYDGTNQSVTGNSRTIQSSNSEYSLTYFLGFLWSRKSSINWIKIKDL